MAKYQPQDHMTIFYQCWALSAVKMKVHEDPTTLFEQISVVELQYNTVARQIEVADMIGVVMEKAPAKYQAILTSKQWRIVAAGNVTMDDLEAAMYDMYWALKHDGNDNNDGEIGQLLFIWLWTKVFA